MTWQRAVTTAKWVHSHYRFSGPPANFAAVLTEHPIVVDTLDWPQELSGVLVRGRKVSSIGVNANHSRGRRHFTLWHEYYHYRVHGDDWHFQCSELEHRRRERECDVFAANVLMPEEWLARLLRRPQWVIAQKLGVSAQALSLRVEELGLRRYE